jgi:pre-mRNA-splicing factor ISY1
MGVWLSDTLKFVLFGSACIPGQRMRLDTNINNHEKSQALVGRFRDTMLAEAGLRRDPFDESHSIPSLCPSIPVCVQNRRQISRELERKFVVLQDASLDEVHLRLVNDEVNKLVRLYEAWNRRIRELGGIKWKERKEVYLQGAEVMNTRTYKWYGRAKELPEAQQAREASEVSPADDSVWTKRNEVLSRLDASYYGYLGEEEENAIHKEEMALMEALAEEETEFMGFKPLPLGSISSPPPIPSPQEAEAALVEWRKQGLIRKYQL